MTRAGRVSSLVNDRQLRRDARNRALRGLYVAVLVALLVDVLPLITAALQPGATPDPVELAKAAVRVSLQAAGAYTLRRFVDPSPIPSPLPPDPPGEPDADTPTLHDDRL